MKTKHNLLKATAFAALVGLMLVCSSHIASAQVININKVVLTRQYVNGEAKGIEVFSPKDRTIYCVVGLTNPAPGAKFKFVWSFYDAAQRKQIQIFEQELSGQNSNSIASKFSSPRDLSIGHYQVEIYIDARLKKRRTFSVTREEEPIQSVYPINNQQIRRIKK